MATASEFLDPAAYYRFAEPDNDASLTTMEGLTAALQQRVDPALFIGRHKQYGHYAILRRPLMSVGPWRVPDIGERPVLVWKLLDETTGTADELGEWIIHLALANDLARQGYETPKEFADAQYKQRADDLEQAAQNRKKAMDERFDEAFDRIDTIQKSTRTVRGWSK